MSNELEMELIKIQQYNEQIIEIIKQKDEIHSQLKENYDSIKKEIDFRQKSIENNTLAPTLAFGLGVLLVIVVVVVKIM